MANGKGDRGMILAAIGNGPEINWQEARHENSLSRKPTMRDADLLVAIGRALHGADWQNPLAEDLGLNSSRNIGRWLKDDRVPVGVWSELGALLDTRRITIDGLIEAARTRI